MLLHPRIALTCLVFIASIPIHAYALNTYYAACPTTSETRIFDEHFCKPLQATPPGQKPGYSVLQIRLKQIWLQNAAKKQYLKVRYGVQFTPQRGCYQDKSSHGTSTYWGVRYKAKSQTSPPAYALFFDRQGFSHADMNSLKKMVQVTKLRRTCVRDITTQTELNTPIACFTGVREYASPNIRRGTRQYLGRYLPLFKDGKPQLVKGRQDLTPFIAHVPDSCEPGEYLQLIRGYSAARRIPPTNSSPWPLSFADLEDHLSTNRHTKSFYICANRHGNADNLILSLTSCGGNTLHQCKINAHLHNTIDCHQSHNGPLHSWYYDLPDEQNQDFANSKRSATDKIKANNWYEIIEVSRRWPPTATAPPAFEDVTQAFKFLIARIYTPRNEPSFKKSTFFITYQSPPSGQFFLLNQQTSSLEAPAHDLLATLAIKDGYNVQLNDAQMHIQTSELALQLKLDKVDLTSHQCLHNYWHSSTQTQWNKHTLLPNQANTSLPYNDFIDITNSQVFETAFKQQNPTLDHSALFVISDCPRDANVCKKLLDITLKPTTSRFSIEIAYPNSSTTKDKAQYRNYFNQVMITLDNPAIQIPSQEEGTTSETRQFSVSHCGTLPKNLIVPQMQGFRIKAKPGTFNTYIARAETRFTTIPVKYQLRSFLSDRYSTFKPSKWPPSIRLNIQNNQDVNRQQKLKKAKAQLSTILKTRLPSDYFSITPEPNTLSLIVKIIPQSKTLPIHYRQRGLLAETFTDSNPSKLNKTIKIRIKPQLSPGEMKADAKNQAKSVIRSKITTASPNTQIHNIRLSEDKMRILVDLLRPGQTVDIRYTKQPFMQESQPYINPKLPSKLTLKLDPTLNSSAKKQAVMQQLRSSLEKPLLTISPQQKIIDLALNERNDSVTVQLRSSQNRYLFIYYFLSPQARHRSTIDMEDLRLLDSRLVTLHEKIYGTRSRPAKNTPYNDSYLRAASNTDPENTLDIIDKYLFRNPSDYKRLGSILNAVLEDDVLHIADADGQVDVILFTSSIDPNQIKLLQYQKKYQLPKNARFWVINLFSVKDKLQLPSCQRSAEDIAQRFSNRVVIDCLLARDWLVDSKTLGYEQWRQALPPR